MNVLPLTSDDNERWDDFCLKSLSGTFLHTRRFLSYHGDRYIDRSIVLVDERGAWLGILPAAEHATEAGVVISHPGITYGGLLHRGAIRGNAMLDAFKAIVYYYRTAGYERLLYKVVPSIYHRSPAQDDVYALFRMHAKRSRSDLSCTIDLASRLPVGERRRRGLKKALKAGIAVHEGRAFDHRLWEVLEDNLARKHQTRPVHTLDEIRVLADRFPDNIRYVAGLIDDRVEAGVLLFITPTVHHAQYIASSETGYLVSALDAIFEHCISCAMRENARWFDFGISTEQSGLLLNEGLQRFKSEFGCGGIVYDLYELGLQREVT